MKALAEGWEANEGVSPLLKENLKLKPIQKVNVALNGTKPFVYETKKGEEDLSLEWGKQVFTVLAKNNLTRMPFVVEVIPEGVADISSLRIFTLQEGSELKKNEIPVSIEDAVSYAAAVQTVRFLAQSIPLMEKAPYADEVLYGAMDFLSRAQLFILIKAVNNFKIDIDDITNDGEVKKVFKKVTEAYSYVMEWDRDLLLKSIMWEGFESPSKIREDFLRSAKISESDSRIAHSAPNHFSYLEGYNLAVDAFLSAKKGYIQARSESRK